MASSPPMQINKAEIDALPPSPSPPSAQLPPLEPPTPTSMPREKT